MSINQDKLLDLLLYAVNEANGWHDDASGGPIQSPEMAQCIAVLVAAGRHPRDCGDGRACLDGNMFDGWQSRDFLGMLNVMSKEMNDMAFFGIPARSTIRVGLPANTWRRLGGEHGKA